MKKLLLCTAALTMFAGTNLAFNNNAHAASNDGITQSTDGNNNPITTQTYFEVDNSSSTVPPVNPFSPDSKLNTNEDHNVKPTNATGNLTIDAVPNKLYFGQTNQNLENGNINETLNGDDSSNADAKYYYAQISDYRNKHTGWHLTASMSQMTDSTESTNTLDGASIIFNKEFIKGAYGNNGKNGENNGIIGNNSVTLSPTSGDVPIMHANNGDGQGTWFELFKNIQLNANKADAGKYEGRITWNLTNGPGTPGQTSNNSSNSQQQ